MRKGIEMLPKMMTSTLTWCIAALAAMAPAFAAEGEKLQVVATLPTLEALAQEVGGDRIETVSLAKGDQDPHFVTPTPVLMKRTREAVLFIENGLSLELWADEVVNGSGNSRIFRGTPGRIIASSGISALEIPSVITRELGDIHPQGNPHVWLDPLLAKVEAGNICEALKAADSASAAYYDARKADFFQRIDTALFGPELLKLLGSQKLTRLAWSGQLQSFLENNKIDDAIKLFKLTAVAYPASSLAFSCLSEAYHKAGRKAPPTEAQFVNLLKDKGVAAARHTLRQVRRTNPEWVLISEFQINRLGNESLTKGQVTVAIDTFKLGLEAYPKSAAIYDSLGAAYLKVGNKKLAMESYQQSIAINPNNSTAKAKLKVD